MAAGARRAARKAGLRAGGAATWPPRRGAGPGSEFWIRFASEKRRAGRERADASARRGPGNRILRGGSSRRDARSRRDFGIEAGAGGADKRHTGQGKEGRAICVRGFYLVKRKRTDKGVPARDEILHTRDSRRCELRLFIQSPEGRHHRRIERSVSFERSAGDATWSRRRLPC